MGKVGDSETAGGGRIVIMVDSMNLNGTGKPLKSMGTPLNDGKLYGYPLQGGTGGYIYVSTFNRVSLNNTISPDVMITADGGFGYLNYFGGNGGVIVFDGNFTFPESQVSTIGG